MHFRVNTNKLSRKAEDVSLNHRGVGSKSQECEKI